VGTLEPRKNLPTLLRALERLRASLGEPPLLVVVGREGWGPVNVAQQLRALDGAVRFAGHTSDEELVALYHAATVFVFPSLYEGFGLPVLEALAAGCPVVSTTTPSIAEAAGEAALLVDPRDHVAMAEAIASLWTDAALARRLRAAGRERAAQFSWERCAELTAAAYRRPPSP
jgi:glycosyltransferase involved in cell wall biosynthesis